MTSFVHRPASGVLRLASVVIVALLSACAAWAQVDLVVVVSFDQYRGDYPKKFAAVGGERGFARIRKEGAEFTKCWFGHAVTKTGPGHATLLTGSNAARTGIMANDMCDLRTESCFYCANPTGAKESAEAMEMPTVGDLLKKKNAKSKVIGISQKDRAAVLMAGRSANAVIWMEKNSGLFTTSAAYPTPTWLSSVAASCDVKKISGKKWNYDLAMSTHAVTSVFQASYAVIQKEQLGRDKDPDLLCIGISATDYLGHQKGPDSKEVEDMFAHCDRMLGALIDTLDKNVGRKKYVLIVTSDHGIAPVPEQVNANVRPREAKIDAGRWKDAQLIARADSALTAAFGKPLQASWVKKLYQPSIYLDHDHLERKKISLTQALDVLQKTFSRMHGIGIVVRTDDMAKGKCPEGTDEALCAVVRAAYHPARSGDITLYPKPYWILGDDVAEHGSPWEYDRWVPLMMIGGPIKKQRSEAKVTPADIAPTIAQWWGIALPPIDGKPLRLKK